MGIRVEVLGLRVWGLGFRMRVWGLAFRLSGKSLEVMWVQSLGLGVHRVCPVLR